MLDLSERLDGKPLGKQIKDNEKAFVELTKEHYMIVSFKQDRGQFAVCLLQQGINDNNVASAYEKYSVGDEVDVRVMGGKSDGGLKLTMPKQIVKASENGGSVQQDLQEGASVTGVLKSIKGHCLFVQVGLSGRIPTIGRLHRIETQKAEFDQFKIGDRIQVKVLRVMKGKYRQCSETSVENGKTWIELTRREAHLKAHGLDEESCSLLSLDTLKQGQSVKALITDVTADASSLVQIQISPFVHSQLLFSDLISADDLKKQSVFKILSKYKVGSHIDVKYNNGRFTTSLEGRSHIKGDLLPVRFVKSTAGFGISVQIDAKTFGTIQLCEISDEITANLIQQTRQKSIFNARIIDTDKNGRLMLSSRQSVVDDWQTIYQGGTAQFTNFDKQNQARGNLRNKIIKFGAKLAIS